MANNNDLVILKELIKRDHIEENGLSTEECGQDDCWANRILKWIDSQSINKANNINEIMNIQDDIQGLPRRTEVDNG